MTNRKKTETAEATNNCRLMSKENLAKKLVITLTRQRYENKNFVTRLYWTESSL